MTLVDAPVPRSGRFKGLQPDHFTRGSLGGEPPLGAVATPEVVAIVVGGNTFRGADAGTAAERRGLGMEIAALARQLKDAPDRVARKAIIVQIRALTEQRERGAFTDAERAQLKEAVAALKNAGIAKTDGGAEGAALWRPRSRSFAHSSCARLPKSHPKEGGSPVFRRVNLTQQPNISFPRRHRPRPDLPQRLGRCGVRRESAKAG